MAFKIFRRLADLLDLDETNKTAGYSVVVNATADGYELSNVSGGGGGGAPTDATYITQTANASLSAEQALSSLATGVVKVTNGTGALSTAAEGTDYYKPGGTDVAVADGGTGASTAAGARTNLGLVIGTDVQAHDADLDTYAGISPSLNVQSVLSAADYAAIRTLLGLVIGTNVQAYDADLTTWAGLTPSAFFQTLVDDADAATARGTLGAAPVSSKYIVQTADSELSGEQALGALATGIVKNTTTTGVLSIATAGTDYYNPGGTDVALADGGTGASLADPNADRILFWDDSAGQMTWLTPGTGLTITSTTIDASGGGGSSTGEEETITLAQELFG